MLKKYEKMILEAYLYLQPCKLLKHQFELEKTCLAGYVTRFLHGERFRTKFVPYDEYELEVIEPLIANNSQTIDGQELITEFLLTKAVCNIMNKHMRKYF